MTGLHDLIDVRDVVFDIRARDVADVASQALAQTLPHHGFDPGEVRRLIEAVAARERESPTTCGTSAIPHARDARIREFVAAIGINRGGLIEGQPEPRVIITFLSPESKRSEHLALLASFARLTRDHAAIDAIAGAQTADEVIALLQRD